MFHKKNFCHVSSTNRGCPQYSIYVYKTTDSVETMLTEGYFNEALLDLQKNDVIAAAIISENDNTEYERVYFRITQRTLDSVSVEQISTDASDVSFDGTGTTYIENAKNVQEALDGLDSAIDTKVSKAGDTMTGDLNFSAKSGETVGRIDGAKTVGGDPVIRIIVNDAQFYFHGDKYFYSPLSGATLGTDANEFQSVYTLTLNGTILVPLNATGTMTINEVSFQTPVTETNKGATMKEIIDVQNTSIKFKGFVSTTEPSSSEFTLFEGNMWINASAMPTAFPVPASSIRVWDGTAWQTTSDFYAPAPLDAWRNENDNKGYYWFGGVWTVMSTDLSPDYFVLDPTDGKWDIKNSINLPGNPTTTTPTTGDNSTKIATTEFVQKAVSSVSDAGDYVIYWDSADATDHSHAKPGVSTPTDNGWYRYYKSGWVEQGGIIPAPATSNTGIAITLPIKMRDANYHKLKTFKRAMDNNQNMAWGWFADCANAAAADTATTAYFSVAESSYTQGAFWEVKGYAA